MKNISIHKKIIILSILALSSFYINAQDIPERPKPPHLVNDYTGILSANQINYLERKLVIYNDTSSTQIVIAIVRSLNGYDKAEFAYGLGEKWGVGQKDFDNGIVILLKPKSGREGGQVFIAPGYGLEGVIPDAICKRIVEHEMIPYFKTNNYFKGLDAATTTLMSLASGEFSADDYKKQTTQSPFRMLIPIIVIFLIIFLMR
ncbi:MAG: TPM domain-containing protein, partial [Bacteroidales bacterium]|nr:TPM domain-containing protein [Bacteroidales bacterium]